MKLKVKKEENIENIPSEFRQNPVSLDWVIIATGRAKRPHQFKEKRKKEKLPSSKNCPFCNLKTLEKQKVIFIYLKEKKIKGYIFMIFRSYCCYHTAIQLQLSL